MPLKSGVVSLEHDVEKMDAATLHSRIRTLSTAINVLEPQAASPIRMNDADAVEVNWQLTDRVSASSRRCIW